MRKEAENLSGKQSGDRHLVVGLIGGLRELETSPDTLKTQLEAGTNACPCTPPSRSQGLQGNTGERPNQYLTGK